VATAFEGFLEEQDTGGHGYQEEDSENDVWEGKWVCLEKLAVAEQTGEALGRLDEDAAKGRAEDACIWLGSAM
jgi:hypothetical protein